MYVYIVYVCIYDMCVKPIILYPHYIKISFFLYYFIIIHSTTEAMEVEGDELVVPDTTTTSTSCRQQPPRCSGNQSVHILRDTLSWGHLCPTSPGIY